MPLPAARLSGGGGALCGTVRPPLQVRLHPGKATTRKLPQWGITDPKLRQGITVRFVRVVLPTGEIEVLATSLLDEVRFPDAVFADLYHERWGSETYYDLIKNRLECENFSGKSAESVRQDSARCFSPTSNPYGKAPGGETRYAKHVRIS